MTIKEVFSCGVIAVRKVEGQFVYLLIKEAQGYWGLPKGHKEEGESDLNAAKRELFEETGIKDIELVEGKTFSCHYPVVSKEGDYEKHVLYFIGFVDKADASVTVGFEHEILDTKWASFEEAQKLSDFASTQKVLEEVNKFLLKNYKK